MSNEVTSHVIIRGLPNGLWAYEIWRSPKFSKPAPNIRGTLEWTPEDVEHPDYLVLVQKVLDSHYLS